MREMVADLAAGLGGTSRRRSFETHSPTAAEWETLSADDIGSAFPFVNREKQCMQLLRNWATTFSVVGNSAEDAQRDLKVASCTGMPGVGKSRFARGALMHILEGEGLGRRGDGEVLSRVELAVWPTPEFAADAGKRAQRVTMLDTLLRACRNGRNFQIECQVMRPQRAAESGESYVDTRLGFELLLASLCRTIGATSAERRRVARDALEQCAPEGCPLAVAIQVLGVTKCESVTSIIVNVDEVQKLGALAEHVLTLNKDLVGAGYYMFITVSGYTPSVVLDAARVSSCPIDNIVLPLLNEDHVKTIILSLATRSGFPDVDSLRTKLDSQGMKSVLWWLGGVPRLLATWLRQLVLDGSVREALGFIVVSNGAALLAKLQLCGSTVYGRLSPTCISSERGVEDVCNTFRGIFALAVSGVLVGPTSEVWTPGSSAGTVESCQKDSLLYWKASDRDATLGRVVVPPLMLQFIMTNYNTADVLLFETASTVMSSADNETTTISALLLRIIAFSIIGKRHVSALELFGALDGIATWNFVVDIPDNPANVKRWEKLSTRYDATNIVEFISMHRRDGEVRAFINGDGASFADAFIIFPRFIAFSQEKQYTIARQMTGGVAPGGNNVRVGDSMAVASGRSRKPPLVTMMRSRELETEYNKVVPAMRLLEAAAVRESAVRDASTVARGGVIDPLLRRAAVLLHVTDQEIHPDAAAFMVAHQDVRVADCTTLAHLHGECLSDLRRFAIHPSRAARVSTAAKVAESLPALSARTRRAIKAPAAASAAAAAAAAAYDGDSGSGTAEE